MTHDDARFLVSEWRHEACPHQKQDAPSEQHCVTNLTQCDACLAEKIESVYEGGRLDGIVQQQKSER